METSFVRAVLFGWVAIAILLIVTTTTLAFIIRFSSISEMTISYVAMIMAFIILFIGGLISGFKGKANGLLIGLCTGGGFTLLTLLVQFLGYNDLFSLYQMLFHLAYMMTAVVGSIIGVNLMQLREQ